mmetsp:Transcript_106257/g.288340  ORF Transcript_106257/g.288340 Transcript_106257/m.288340 type:complete len:219 (-) Transcript_106257:103-759(-)
MALFSAPFECFVCAALLVCMGHCARDMESVSSLASLESEVKHLDEASESVVEATASGRIIARHMLERASPAPQPPGQSVEEADKPVPPAAAGSSPVGGKGGAGAGQQQLELSVEELLEILPDQCSDAKAQNRLTRMLDFGKSDYQVQVNELANKCKDLQSSQKQAKKITEKINQNAEKLSAANLEYEEFLIHLQDMETDIKQKGELVENMDKAMKGGR